MANYIYTNDGELMHYGVPGMKWGVRKDYDPNERSKYTKKYYDYSPNTFVEVKDENNNTRPWYQLRYLKEVAENFDEILESTGHKLVSEITYEHDPSMWSDGFMQTSISSIRDAYNEYRDSEEWD